MQIRFFVQFSFLVKQRLLSVDFTWHMKVLYLVADLKSLAFNYTKP